MVSVREQSKFSREGVRVFHLASTHFVYLVKSVGENNQYGSPQQERVMAEAICDNSFYFIPLGGRKIQTKDGDYVNK